MLDSHELVRSLFEVTLNIARSVLPGLEQNPLAEPLGSAAYIAPAYALAAIMLWLAAIYLSALILLDRALGASRAAVWLVLGAAGVFQITLLNLPGLFSQDVFSYIAYGRLAAIYDLNPYVWPPSAVAKDAALPWVAAVWRSYASPYGPLWSDVEWAMARLFGGSSIVDQAIAYRALANALLLGNLGLLWSLLGRLTPLTRAARTTALAALAWNPLVLFEVAANAHNDVLMVSFSLLALLLLSSRRWSNGLLSGIGFTLGALVKYLSGVGLIWLAVASAARGPSLSVAARAVRLSLLILVCAVAVFLVALPWLELPDSLEPLVAETANVGYVNSLPDSLALAVADGVLSPAGVQPLLARNIARGVERLLVLASFGVYLVWELRRVWSEPTAAGVARACARSCLVYVLVASISVQSWYFCLPVALALGLGWRTGLAQVSVGYSVLALPALYLNYYLRASTPLAVNVLYGLLPLLPLALTKRPADFSVRGGIFRMLANRGTIVPGRG
jgi:hypothetical protein